MPEVQEPGIGVGCGEGIRTSDLRVMSPTSCRCSTPRPRILPAAPGTVKRGPGGDSAVGGLDPRAERCAPQFDGGRPPDVDGLPRAVPRRAAELAVDDPIE